MRVILLPIIGFMGISIGIGGGIGIMGGCGGGSAPSSSSPQTSSSTATSSAAAASSSPRSPSPAASGTISSSLHKRARTAPPKSPGPDGTKPKNGRPLNAKDNLGRTVFVRPDDLCFVEVAPPKDKTSPDAAAADAEGPITRASELVDCPPATDDAAWDHCSAQIVLDENGTKCYCVTGAGHPRPMPYPTPCPASAAASAKGK